MRPVKNVTDPVTVKFKLKLSQLIDVVSAIADQSCPKAIWIICSRLCCYIPLNDTWIDAVQMVLQMQIDVNPDINAYCETALEYADAAEV